MRGAKIVFIVLIICADLAVNATISLRRSDNDSVNTANNSNVVYDGYVQHMGCMGFISEAPTCNTNSSKVCPLLTTRRSLPSSQAGVRCCFNEVIPECASVLGSPGQCVLEATYDEAVTFCAHDGKRLCTVEQLQMDVCCASGCGLNTIKIWTSDRCSIGEPP